MGLFGGGNSSTSNYEYTNGGSTPIYIGGSGPASANFGQGSFYIPEIGATIQLPYGLDNSTNGNGPNAGTVAQAPNSSVSGTTSGSNSPVTTTINNVPTSNAQTQGQGSAVLSNVNAGGAITVTPTDLGALNLAGSIVDMNAGLTGHLVDSVVSSVAATQADFTKNLMALNATSAAVTNNEITTLADSISSQGNTLSNALYGALASSSAATSQQLAFYGDQSARLNQGTIAAIQAQTQQTTQTNADLLGQATATLQTTGGKIAAVIVGAIIVHALLSKKGRLL